MKPMLARPFKAELIKWPGFVQPKLNGLRALWLEKEGVLLSRDQNVWMECVLPQVFEALKEVKEFCRFWYGDKLKNFIGFDGEIYCHGMSLQQINSRGAVIRKSPHADCGKLRFNVFDIISNEPQDKRFEFHTFLTQSCQARGIEWVPTHFCQNQNSFDELYNLYFHQLHYEGVMWRDEKAGYGFEHLCTNQENRWNCIVKRKPRQDVVARILNRVEGEGKHAGMVGGHGVSQEPIAKSPAWCGALSA